MSTRRPDARPPAPVLVGLSGRPGVGKHEVARILAESHGFRGVAIIDPIRDMLYELDPMLGNGLTLRMLVDDLGWTTATRHRLYGPEVCRLLQSFECGVGQDMISATLWTDLAACACRELIDSGHPVVVTDIRRPEQAGMISRLGGTVVQVVRPVCDSGEHVDRQDEHPNRAAAVPVRADRILCNDGDLALLRARVVELAENLQEGLVHETGRRARAADDRFGKESA